MGIIANEKLGEHAFSKKAVVYTGTSPPISCMVDGIQLSSGCTLGKGNIEVIDDKRPLAEFYNRSDKRLKIKLKDSLREEIDSTVTEENMISYTQNLWKKNDEELFDIL